MPEPAIEPTSHESHREAWLQLYLGRVLKRRLRVCAAYEDTDMSSLAHEAVESLVARMETVHAHRAEAGGAVPTVEPELT